MYKLTFVIALLLLSLSCGFSNTYRYDDNGNLICDTNGNRYYYNAKNQLITFIQGKAKIKSRFHYNANDLLDNSKSAQHIYHFIYQQRQLSNLIVNNQKIISTLQKDIIYVNAKGHNTPYYRTAMHNNTQTLLLSQNVSLMDVDNFTPFGTKRALNQDSTNPEQELSMVKSLFAYDGEYQDQASQLIYLHARFYNPGLMRFMQRDSYDLLNHYAFANDNPVNKTDPSGHNAIASLFHGLGEGLISGMSIGFCSTEGCGVKNYKQLFSGNERAWAEFLNPIAALVPLIQHGGNTDEWMNAIGMSLPNMAITMRDMMTAYYSYQLRETMRTDYQWRKSRALEEGTSLQATTLAHYNKIAQTGFIKDVSARRNGFNYVFNPVLDIYHQFEDDHFSFFKDPPEGLDLVKYQTTRVTPWDFDLTKKLFGKTQWIRGAEEVKLTYDGAVRNALMAADLLLYSINTNSLNQYNQTADGG
ncbi:RHS repeat-associated core domain-containing protein [Facilibium subflavum]|uniref:RHS repeat-associated core domain-containing protein n=1 Tax=Facilibium subflavum TaxID=2219058 RepID=UPI000E65E0CE|nr:RHS repeat-associated core domain-containing protein [Facilibium subflavum]